MYKKTNSKAIILIIYCILIFFVSLFIWAAVMNQGNTDMTTEMASPTLPVMNFRYDTYNLETLYGYVEPMEISSMRESLTPLMPERKVSFRVNTYDKKIVGLRYELRTTDGERLLESEEIIQYLQTDKEIIADITFKDLMEVDEEYSLCIILKTLENQEIYYYTRIFQGEGIDPSAMLYFAYNFSNKTFHKAEAQNEITMYLESDERGDNTTFQRVDIHSSFYQITWGDLQVLKVTSPEASILDITPELCSIKLDYMVNIPHGAEEVYYHVEEFYRMRRAPGRMYLLDYERTLQEIFTGSQRTIANNKFVLGIRDDQVHLVENEDASRFAFESQGKLYAYNVTDNKLTEVFSFYTEDMADRRATHMQYGVNIFSVDETGNIQFLVYGYMNRGEHEGTVGIGLYYYDSLQNTIEELMYLPYTQSYEILKAQVEELSYVNTSNKCILYLDGNVYEFDFMSKESRILAENMQKNSFVVSEDHRLIAMVKDENQGEQIEMINLMNDRRVLISTKQEEVICPLGFFGSDLIYGLAYKSDIGEDAYGNTLFPMYKIVICTEGNQVIHEYEQENTYIVHTEISPSMVYMERVQKNDEGDYVAIDPDQILNNQMQASNRITVETVVTDYYETIVQLALRKQVDVNQLQYLTPRFLVTEGSNQAYILPRDQQAAHSPLQNHYSVYSKGHLFADALYFEEAVALAHEENGVVVDANGQLAYHRTMLPERNQIMAITGHAKQQTEQEAEALAVCLNTILEYEGITQDVRSQVYRGTSAREILETYLPGRTIRPLYDCPLEAALSYVARDLPVLVELGDGKAVLLIGFNAYNTVVMNPENGEVYKVGLEDSRAWFAENGNCFLTYE